MAAAAEVEDDVRECSNCGETRDLLKCSRCQSAWFCSVRCQKAYWPFHRATCHRNEFADATQASEPKFANWMRKHHKLAVLKDDEVDRLERASTATTGSSREEVMDSMYNRMDPKPRGPKYSAEEMIAMRKKAEEEELQARLVCSRMRAWEDIRLPEDMGMDCGHYKWYQNQSFVELAFPLPEHTQPKEVQDILTPNSIEVQVVLMPSSIEVRMGMRSPLKGQLWAEVKVEDSTWYVQDGLLSMQLLKRNRRGHYANGSNNAETFWMSVLKKAPEKETLRLEYPPLAYYNSYIEPEAVSAHRMLTMGKRTRSSKVRR